MDDTEKKAPSAAPAAPSGIKLNLIPKGNAPVGVPATPVPPVSAPTTIAPAKPAFDDSSTVQLRRTPVATEEIKPAPVAITPRADKEDTSTKSIARPKVAVTPPAGDTEPAKSAIKLAPKTEENTATVKLKAAPKINDASQTVKLTATPVIPLPKKIELTPATTNLESKAPAVAVEAKEADKPAVKPSLKMKTEKQEEKATPPRLKSDMEKLQSKDSSKTGNAQVIITVLVVLLVLYAAALTVIQFLNFSNGVVFDQKLVDTPIEVPGFMIGK